MKKAFTLIEVMVVLSILAIIAILGYNFFGSMMKEAKLSQAATRLHKDTTMLLEAMELYGKKNNYDYSALTFVDMSTNRLENGLVDGGFIRSHPKYDSTFVDPGKAAACPGTVNPEYGWYAQTNADMTGDGKVEGRIQLDGLDHEMCLKFREIYMGDTGAVPPSSTYVGSVEWPIVDCTYWLCNGEPSYGLQAFFSVSDFE